MRIERAAVTQGLLALTLGTTSGWIASTIHLPLPWMLGSMLGVTIAALAGAPIRAPIRLRPIMIPVIGVMLGSSITPDIIAALGRWTFTVLLLIPFLISTAVASYYIYRRLGKYDPTTAFFSAMPGGLNDMLVMGAEAGGVERQIALAHALRIFCVITFVVLFYGLALGVTSGGVTRNWVALSSLSVRDLAILGACAAIGAPLGMWARLPAAPVFGPMILSGIAHVAGLVDVPPPSILVIMAQIVIGTVVGCRFLGARLRDIGFDMVLGLLSSVAMLMVAILFAVIVTEVTGIDLSQSFLAYSPGGLAEMSLLALAMGQDVAYVSVMHVVRLTLVIGVASPLFRVLKRVG